MLMVARQMPNQGNSTPDLISVLFLQHVLLLPKAHAF